MTYDLRSSQVIVAAATRAVDFSMNESWAPARVIQRSKSMRAIIRTETRIVESVGKQCDCK